MYRKPRPQSRLNNSLTFTDSSFSRSASRSGTVRTPQCQQHNSRVRYSSLLIILPRRRRKLDNLMRQVKQYKTKAAGSLEARTWMHSSVGSTAAIPSGNNSRRRLDYSESELQISDLLPCLRNRSPEKQLTVNRGCQTAVHGGKDAATQTAEAKPAGKIGECTEDEEFVRFLKSVSLFCQSGRAEDEGDESEHNRLYKNLTYLRTAFRRYKEIESQRSQENRSEGTGTAKGQSCVDEENEQPCEAEEDDHVPDFTEEQKIESVRRSEEGSSERRDSSRRVSLSQDNDVG